MLGKISYLPCSLLRPFDVLWCFIFPFICYIKNFVLCFFNPSCCLVNYVYICYDFEQVTWAGFDILEVEPSVIRHVLLLGYLNGFQVLDVEDASNFKELVSKRGGPVSFLQLHPSPVKLDTSPAKPDSHDVLRRSHPLLLIVAGEESKDVAVEEPNHIPMGGHPGSCANSHNAVQFYSLKSHSYAHVLRFRSAVCMVRCSSQIVAVGLATQVRTTMTRNYGYRIYLMVTSA